MKLLLIAVAAVLAMAAIGSLIAAGVSVVDGGYGHAAEWLRTAVYLFMASIVAGFIASP